MMARRWPETEHTAVWLAAALDYEDGGQRLGELAARLDLTEAGCPAAGEAPARGPVRERMSRDHEPSGHRVCEGVPASSGSNYWPGSFRSNRSVVPVRD